MKIGFDAKRFFNNFTGLGNYSRFVVGALSEHAPDNEYFLYTPKVRSHPEFDSILGQRNNLTVIDAPASYRFFKATSLWRTWTISAERSIHRLDVFHGLSQELPLDLPRRVKKIVTVHDLIFIRYPKLYNRIDVSIYKAKVKAACQQADRILATSKQTQQDIIDFLKIEPSKIEVVYQGCHPNFRQKLSPERLKEIKAKYNLPDQFILSVGTIEERKNVILLIKSLALLPKEFKIPVVIIGRPTPYKEKIIAQASQLGVMEWVRFLHDVSFTDLPGIYQGAQVFVYPSIFEGFGIPIVEALESSVPVISSRGSCLTEAGGPGSIYVDPHSEEELTFHLKRVLKDDQLRSQMALTGKRYIQQFAPAVIAKKLMATYQSV